MTAPKRHTLLAGAIGPCVEGGEWVSWHDCEALMAEIDHLREANRKLHRRAQEIEAPAQSYKDQLRYLRDSYGDRWHWEFNRLIESHGEVKRIFHELTRLYDYPMNGRCLHSVMDSNVEKCREPKQEGVYANCFLSNTGGMKSYRVLDEVRRAVNELLDRRAGSLT